MDRAGAMALADASRSDWREMSDDGHDPLWARRLAWRALKAAAALVVALVLVFVVWTLLPEDAAAPVLHLSTNSEVLLRGESLGTGNVVIDAAALREAGVVVPAGASLEAICGALFPGEEFRGPIMVDASSIPRETAGFECYLQNAGSWRIARVWVFAIEDDQWLAVPIQFRDTQGRVHTTCPASDGSMGWALTRAITKRRSHSVTANLRATDGTYPEEGSFRVGPDAGSLVLPMARIVWRRDLGGPC